MRPSALENVDHSGERFFVKAKLSLKLSRVQIQKEVISNLKRENKFL
jgi:hypothetical protein